MASTVVDVEPVRTADTRLRPVAAFRALRDLARSEGKDLHAGVAFLRATQGRSAIRAFARFRAGDVGRRILDRRIILRDRLLERDALERLPAESLGRSYLAFMERENVAVPSLLDLAQSCPEVARTAEERLFAERTHVMHDLWHVVAGYGTEPLGEVCILAIRSAQMRHVGVWILCLGGMRHVENDLGRARARAAVREAFTRGRRAAWLYGVDWEAMLPQPLEAVRRALNLTPPVRYQSAIGA
ncbi:MAG: Coq4 family protein [Acetobacteraceae bacterium]|nr:hypothetical protein [Pseudomonadota bacterium]